MTPSELRDRLRSAVTRLLHERDGTMNDLVREAEPLGVVFPWDIGKEIEALRTIIGRTSSDSTYSADQAVADARTLGIEITDPNPQLTSWREAEASCREYEERYKAEFARTGLVVGAEYTMTNGDLIRIERVEYSLGAMVRVYNMTIGFEMSFGLSDLMKRLVLPVSTS